MLQNDVPWVTIQSMAIPANTRFALAVHALTLVGSEPGRIWTSAEIAGSAGASPVHMRRVLGRMRTAGWVTSRPGVSGGWVMLVEARELSLADIWRALQGSDPVMGLHRANPDCERGQRIQRELERIEREVADSVEERLGGLTLRDIVAATAPGGLR